METQKLIVRLPQDDLRFIKRFTVDHVSPKLHEVIGVLPQDLDTQAVKQDYYEHLLDKHR